MCVCSENSKPLQDIFVKFVAEFIHSVQLNLCVVKIHTCVCTWISNDLMSDKYVVVGMCFFFDVGTE